MPYTYQDHPADIAISFTAPDLPSLFHELLAGWLDILLGGSLPAFNKEDISLTVEADSLDEICISFLQEINFRFHAQGVCVTGIKEAVISRHPAVRLNCIAETAPSSLFSPQREIKAVTYHGAELVHENGKYSIQVVFDI